MPFLTAAKSSFSSSLPWRYLSPLESTLSVKKWSRGSPKSPSKMSFSSSFLIASNLAASFWSSKAAAGGGVCSASSALGSSSSRSGEANSSLLGMVSMASTSSSMRGCGSFCSIAITKSAWPRAAATCNGVMPSLFLASGDAPLRRRRWKRGTAPFRAAACMGVLPSLSFSSTAQPLDTSRVESRTWPFCTAKCKGLRCWFTDLAEGCAPYSSSRRVLSVRPFVAVQ
mmetsp:Transcript_1937/g.6952  ORF Transcript_1937/g.6952 Transcript_1937/m.6952 type:complete len:227 (-) Transcript_1937:530-1210(-)